VTAAARERRVKLKPCGLYFCVALIPWWRRACWRHQSVFEAAALIVVAIAAVIFLSAIN
jgi:hypothetical protein